MPMKSATKKTGARSLAKGTKRIVSKKAASKKAAKTGPPKKRARRSTSAGSGSFAPVFAALRALLAPFEERLAVRSPNAQYVYLESHEIRHKGKPMYFGAVRLGKNYVSYHLMPVYGCPDLLQGASPELMKRMQGKSCFNFTSVDERLFDELAQLTQAGYDRFKSLKYL